MHEQISSNQIFYVIKAFTSQAFMMLRHHFWSLSKRFLQMHIFTCLHCFHGFNSMNQSKHTKSYCYNSRMGFRITVQNKSFKKILKDESKVWNKKSIWDNLIKVKLLHSKEESCCHSCHCAIVLPSSHLKTFIVLSPKEIHQTEMLKWF